MPQRDGGPVLMRALRIGVTGCADIARRRVLPAMTASAGVEVVAIASRDRRRAEELAGDIGCRAVHGYAALLARDDIDAVYTPLPAALHAPWVEAALLAGKHVLAEKPLTTDPARTAELLALAAKRGLVLMENVMFVHHGQHAAVRQLLADRAIGELRAFHAAFAIPRPPAHDIRLSAALGGGALLDTGLYPVRAALHFLGDRLRVAGAVLRYGSGHAVDVAGSALLSTPDGIQAQLTFGMDHAYRSTYELWGTSGRITVDRAFTPPARHSPVLRVDRAAGVELVTLPAEDQVANTVAAFAAAVRAGPVPDRDVLPQAVLLDQIRQAAHRIEPSTLEAR